MTAVVSGQSQLGGTNIRIILNIRPKNLFGKSIDTNEYPSIKICSLSMKIGCSTAILAAGHWKAANERSNCYDSKVIFSKNAHEPPENNLCLYL